MILTFHKHVFNIVIERTAGAYVNALRAPTHATTSCALLCFSKQMFDVLFLTGPEITPELVLRPAPLEVTHCLHVARSDSADHHLR